jgi:predicted ArsR family transcriptional regulator
MAKYDDPRILRAIAHPHRNRILSELYAAGPLRAADIARRIDIPANRASFHLRQLAKYHLVEEAPELARDRRERWWRLVDTGTRWSRADFADDTAAVTAAHAAEALALQRQFERVQEWNAQADTVPEWDAAAFATQNWLRLSPAELEQVAEEVIDVLMHWGRREPPDDGVEREPVLVFARGFPAQP